jgi:hypothetical protein
VNKKINIDPDPANMIRIDSGYFCAGVDLEDDRVVKAAPIVKYMVGWTRRKVESYCRKKNWKFLPL